MSPLPEPPAQALLHQQKLLAHLKNIYYSKGPLNFADFMQIVLYAPGLGYYSAGMQKFGASGDFVTAPQISPLFSECLGRQCAQILSELKTGDILELGAGEGVMAADLLHTLNKMHQLPEHYYILEVSADLKARQQVLLKARCPEYFEQIVWLNTLPQEPFTGIILGNEVLDAMPVHLFKIGQDEAILEAHIEYNDEKWQCEFQAPTTATLTQGIREIQQALDTPMTSGYISEVNLGLIPFMASLAQCLNQGVMLFIDYGFGAREYYHPARHMGTLMCHYRHHAHADPLQFIGLQDITAHVDFTAVAKAGLHANLDLLGFTTQAAFLLANGLLNGAPSTDALQQLQYSQQIQQLMQTHEMGELFKVIALGKNYAHPLAGFSFRDFTHRL